MWCANEGEVGTESRVPTSVSRVLIAKVLSFFQSFGGLEKMQEVGFIYGMLPAAINSYFMALASARSD